MRQGNVLLEEVFGNQSGSSSSLEDDSLFHPLEPIPNFKRFAGNQIGKFPDALDFEDVPNQVSTVLAEGRGLHEIAWYLPYRRYGQARWGIWFDAFAMTRLSMEVATIARLINPGITNSESQKVVYASVMRHEIEHAIQELLLAKSVQANDFNLADLTNAPFNVPGSYRETIASHFEHLDSLSGLSKIQTSRVNLIRHALQGMAAPPVYDAWRSTSIQHLDNTYESDLGVVENLGTISGEERRLVNGRSKSSYIDIPVYLWFGNGLGLTLTGVDLRANTIDCKKMLRLMKRGGLTRMFGDDIQAVWSSDHDLKVKNPVLRPIKFSCHDWDSVPDNVLAQFAMATGLSVRQFVERVRAQM